MMNGLSDLINLVERPFVSEEPVPIDPEIRTHRTTSIDVGLFNILRGAGLDNTQPQSESITEAPGETSSYAAVQHVGEQLVQEAQQPQEQAPTPTANELASTTSSVSVDTLRDITGIDAPEQRQMEQQVRAEIERIHDEAERARMDQR
jgi:hypothetical protein